MPDIYETITNKLIKELESGNVPWHKPWACGGDPANLVSGKEYRGINRFALGMLAPAYTSRYWVTFKQAKKLGGHVKRGSKGMQAWYFDKFKKRVEDKETGEEKSITIPFWRCYTVFNVCQCEGIKHKRLEEEKERKGKRTEFERIECAEEMVDGWKNCPPIIHGGGRAYYSPSEDTIGVPERTAFESSGEYYSTLFHEVTHSTGSKKRLNREWLTKSKGFGSNPYAKEELVAEFGAAFFCGHCGIEDRGTFENSAAYLRGWLTKLKNDKKLAVTAATRAQEAVDVVIKERRVTKSKAKKKATKKVKAKAKKPAAKVAA